MILSEDVRNRIVEQLETAIVALGRAAPMVARQALVVALAAAERMETLRDVPTISVAGGHAILTITDGAATCFVEWPCGEVKRYELGSVVDDAPSPAQTDAHASA